jgi:hypothetical protein
MHSNVEIGTASLLYYISMVKQEYKRYNKMCSRSCTLFPPPCSHLPSHSPPTTTSQLTVWTRTCQLLSNACLSTRESCIHVQLDQHLCVPLLSADSNIKILHACSILACSLLHWSYKPNRAFRLAHTIFKTDVSLLNRAFLQHTMLICDLSSSLQSSPFGC